MPKRLLVTGARGFVAGRILDQATHSWEIHALSREISSHKPVSVNWHSMNPFSSSQLTAIFNQIKPHSVIHTAAMADIDYCEAHQQEAELINIEFTRVLAECCQKNKTRLVYLSTDNVFDGVRGFYSEEDTPNPVNFYGKTKLAAEETVTQLLDSFVIARVALVMGLPIIGHGNSFLARMLDVLGSGRQLSVPDEEIRSPIDVITLAQALLELVENDFSGILHLAGNDILNRFEMAQKIAMQFGYSSSDVVPGDPTGLPGRAPRPRDVSLNNKKARSTLKAKFLGVDKGIAVIIENRNAR